MSNVTHGYLQLGCALENIIFQTSPRMCKKVAPPLLREAVIFHIYSFNLISTWWLTVFHLINGGKSFPIILKVLPRVWRHTRPSALGRRSGKYYFPALRPPSVPRPDCVTWRSFTYISQKSRPCCSWQATRRADSEIRTLTRLNAFSPTPREAGYLWGGGGERRGRTG